MNSLVITPDLSPETLRAQLIAELKPGDTVTVTISGELRFTQIRSHIAIVNAAAFARSCTLRYSDEREFRPPPLAARYTHEPTIHPHDYKKPA